jgi:predicted GH43/DUF377 family glycosyl hydrolase
MRVAVAACCLALTGCYRYSDFALPVLPGQPGAVAWKWDVHPTPVIGNRSDWARVDALNPSVLDVNGSLRNLYSGYDGKMWRTGITFSVDGLLWNGDEKVLAPDPSTWEGDYIAANGTAVYDRGRYLYWYQAGRNPRIGLAISVDAKRWSKHPNPVLRTGPRGSWDERGVADPYVIRQGEFYYMYYLGEDRARRQRLGVARSVDGITWTKYRDGPILELGAPGAFDELGLGEPAVWSQHGWYWMLYTGRDRREFRRLGLARSRDGVNWTRVTEEPVLSGTHDWDSKVVCDPSVLVEGDIVRVWFGGGNRAEPAENLNGKIGYATLKITLTP